MSKKKGMSIEEKVLKVEEWFIENPHPFTMKDILAIVPRAKGVIFQSIEECIELLISEGRVTSEKIGINVFYWRFVQTEAQRAAAAASKKKNSSGGEVRGANARATAESLSFFTVEKLLAMQTALLSSITERDEDLRRQRDVIGDFSERVTLKEKLASLRARAAEVERKLADVADQDPAVVDALLRQSKTALEAANRWTDNIFIMEQQVTRPGSGLMMSSKQFRQQFQIPPQLDFIEMG